MTLQFPHARLLIHNLLADEHLSGAEAIARVAVEYGVIPKYDAENSELKRAIVNCDCCEAAHCVLSQYFKTHGAKSEDYLESAWKSIIHSLERYKNCAYKSGNGGTELSCQQACSNLAPVVFDLLLQEVRRYS
ncbi:MAG: hypothetical protein K2Y39_24195 [Candidatus Obscuribacterales bacterium]|nr:hypothetical protein [Candidatus Obscuribacterales bacterium]